MILKLGDSKYTPEIFDPISYPSIDSVNPVWDPWNKKNYPVTMTQYLDTEDQGCY